MSPFILGIGKLEIRVGIKVIIIDASLVIVCSMLK